MVSPPITHPHPEEVAGGCSRGGRTGGWGKDPAGRARYSGGAGPLTLAPNGGPKAPSFLGQGAGRSAGREVAAAALRLGLCLPQLPKGCETCSWSQQTAILKLRRLSKAAGDTREPPPDQNHLKLPPPELSSELSTGSELPAPASAGCGLWGRPHYYAPTRESKTSLQVNKQPGRAQGDRSLPRRLLYPPHPLTF